MNDDFGPLLEEVDFLVAEARMLRGVGPRIRFLLTNGEEVVMAALVHRSRSYSLRLSTRGLVVLEYLATHRHRLLTAAQIQSGISSLAASRRCRRNAGESQRIGSSNHVKVYIQRLRAAFGQALLEAGLPLDASRVVVSESSDSNTTLYSLKCSVEWLCEDRPVRFLRGNGDT